MSKDRDSIINMDQVTCLFAGSDGYTVRATYGNGNGCQMGRYNSPVAAEVIKMIGLAIGKTDVYFMPDDDDVKIRIAENDARWHHATGKKTKGHGGS